jgi:poly-gamma-glutamate synthesis protein (capsule biosynthesis protein)
VRSNVFQEGICMNSGSDLSMMFVGDSMFQHRVSQLSDPPLVALRELMSQADLTMVNLEGAIHDGRDWPGFVAGQGGFGSPYLAMPPWVTDELRNFNVNCVFAANNHASDFAEGGILTTIKYLDRVGIAHPGIGRNLTEATGPAYVYTPKGRIAVIAAADNGPRGRALVPFPVPRGCFAADGGPGFVDRPGINFLRYEPILHVNDRVFESLQEASRELTWDYEKESRLSGRALLNPSVGAVLADFPRDTEDTLFYGGFRYQRDSSFYFETVPFPDDLERNYRSISAAKKNADIVVVGLHQQGASWNEDEPSDHTMIFAHGAIDAGADVVVAHGNGLFGGIEIYKGKVIILGLPGFISQLLQRTKVPSEQFHRLGLDPTTAMPADVVDLLQNPKGPAIPSSPVVGEANPAKAYFLCSVMVGDDRQPKKVTVHPLEVRGGTGFTTAATGGYSVLAGPENPINARVLDLMTERSAKVGTSVAIKDGIGVIEV